MMLFYYKEADGKISKYFNSLSDLLNLVLPVDYAVKYLNKRFGKVYLYYEYYNTGDLLKAINPEKLREVRRIAIDDISSKFMTNYLEYITENPSIDYCKYVPEADLDVYVRWQENDN